jgi:hypothetical protein
VNFNDGAYFVTKWEMESLKVSRGECKGVTGDGLELEQRVLQKKLGPDKAIFEVTDVYVGKEKQPDLTITFTRTK